MPWPRPHGSRGSEGRKNATACYVSEMFVLGHRGRSDQEMRDIKKIPSKSEKENTKKDKLGGTTHRSEHLY
jgi:hypothetical protein